MFQYLLDKEQLLALALKLLFRGQLLLRQLLTVLVTQDSVT